MDESRILAAYDETTAATLNTWREHMEIGGAEPYRDDTRRLCFSSGCKFSTTGVLRNAHEALLACALEDDAFDVTPATGLHFSFLAMSWGLYDEPEEYVNDAGDLIAMFKQHTAGLHFRITQLRLVPLRNTLLLAGVPDEQSFAARQRFTDAVRQSRWQSMLEARYRGYVIPPLFWHTTLARYNRKFAPAVMRAVHAQFAAYPFDDLSLGSPVLALVNYNWTRCFPLYPRVLVGASGGRPPVGQPAVAPTTRRHPSTPVYNFLSDGVQS